MREPCEICGIDRTNKNIHITCNKHVQDTLKTVAELNLLGAKDAEIALLREKIRSNDEQWRAQVAKWRTKAISEVSSNIRELSSSRNAELLARALGSKNATLKAQVNTLADVLLYQKQHQSGDASCDLQTFLYLRDEALRAVGKQ